MKVLEILIWIDQNLNLKGEAITAWFILTVVFEDELYTVWKFKNFLTTQIFWGNSIYKFWDQEISN